MRKIRIRKIWEDENFIEADTEIVMNPSSRYFGKKKTYGLKACSLLSLKEGTILKCPIKIDTRIG